MNAKADTLVVVTVVRAEDGFLNKETALLD